MAIKTARFRKYLVTYIFAYRYTYLRFSGIVAGLFALFLGLILPGVAGSQGAGTPLYLPVQLQHWPTATATPMPGYLLITEVMYDPDGDEPTGEWIELYNAGGTDINLSMYKVGDEELQGGSEGMYQFPVDALLPAGEVIVVANQAVTFYELFKKLPNYELRESHPFIPNLVKYTPWSGGNAELSNNGDDVLILDLYDQKVDGISWGSSSFELDPPLPRIQEGHSFERKPAFQDTNSLDDWIDQDIPTPGKVDISLPTPTPTVDLNTPTPAGPASLLISEVLYDPTGVDPSGEWFEIYNYGSSLMSLEGLKIGDEEVFGGGEGMLLFPAGIFLAPEQVLVIANRAEVFSSTYGLNPDLEIYDTDPLIPEMLRDSAWGSGSVNLGNSGDELLLLDRSGILLDTISWGSSTTAFDPSVQLVAEGHSLERYPPGDDTDRAADWRDQPTPNPRLVDHTPPTQVPPDTPTPTATPTATSELNTNR